MAAGSRHLIVNADDFGASRGVNRGIIEGHTEGVVTSASLLVTGSAVDEAVALSREHRDLAVGLHWDVWGEDERDFDVDDHDAVRSEFARQLKMFEDLMQSEPTHVDSHKHAHLRDGVFAVVQELVEPLEVPLRGDGRVNWIGGFYAQWEWRVTDLEHVSVDALEGILRNEVPSGWTEISCHPGYRSPDYESVYLDEREAELRTLCDPAVRSLLGELGLELSSYRDWSVARSSV
ncbi:MAG: ChbG/HpnK family deacetylase [Acidimicrobiia bacterium]|nr:ChbG/HpnK family deacetylase [Acidimicrobiia bacterium]